MRGGAHVRGAVREREAGRSGGGNAREEQRVGVVVRKGQVDVLMEGEDRRRRARDLEVVAMSKTETGGSAQLNIALLIQDILHQSRLTSNSRLLLYKTFFWEHM